MTEAIAVRMDVSALLATAVEKGAGVDTMERLLAMAKEVRAEQARAAWHEAMARFQAEAPEITKDKTAKVQTRTGGSYTYRYAALDSIIARVRPILSKHGLSVTFQTQCTETRVMAACLVAHALGHVEACEFSVPIAVTGRMNPAQEIGSASTYARRYALTAALGLAPEDDDDGQAAGGAVTRQKSADDESNFVGGQHQEESSGPAPRATEATSRQWPARGVPPPDRPAVEGSPVWTGRLVDMTTKQGGTKGKPWTLFTFKAQDGETFGTFSETLASSLLKLDKDAFVEIVYSVTEKGNKTIEEWRNVTAEQVPL